jgi:NAD(P)-dependent dehydrogenase (short-subunit alcohol dehydrogenase family)
MATVGSGTPSPGVGSLSDLFGLEGRVAIVTGASSGLGERFARVLAGAGAQVVGAARRTEHLERLADDVPGITPFTCDMTVDEDLQRLVDFTIERHGRIDVLVNNAGVGGLYAPEDEPVEHFRHVLDVDLTALFALSQLVGRHMIQRGGGSIINIASMFGVVGSWPEGLAGYCAAKGGVVNLTRELAVHWAQHRLRVNAIAPGWFPTELTAQYWQTDEAQAFLAERHPYGRIGLPHELDGILLLLAGDAGTYITGQVVTVDGGYTAY